MDASRFDRLVRRLAARPLSRRTALQACAARLAVTTLPTRAAAGQCTPPATAAGGLAANNATYFVQTATGGSFRPNPQLSTASPAPGTPTAARHGAYLLTLAGHDGETIGFSDRPQRRFGEVDTPRFFKSMGFVPSNPPNAALVADLTGRPGAVVLVELLHPRYDAGTQTLTYEVDLLHQYPNARGSALAPLATNSQATPPPPTFGAASLFIDDCPDGTENCFRPNTSCPSGLPVGEIVYGNCWNWQALACLPCRDYSYQCNSTYPEDFNNTCVDELKLCGDPGCCTVGGIGGL